MNGRYVSLALLTATGQYNEDLASAGILQSGERRRSRDE